MKRVRPGPTALRAVQGWMASAITAPLEPDPAVVERYVSPGPRMNASARLDVYRSAYRGRLVERLRDDYPVLCKMLGEARFAALSDAYIARYPSSSANLNGYGRRLPAFCRESSPGVLGRQADFAAELAALERAVVEVVHAEASRSLDVGPLQSSPPECWAAARFVASDAVRLQRFECGVNAYYRATLERDDMSDPPASAPTATVVYRSEVAIRTMDLTPVMARLLAPLLAGEPIGHALAAIESVGAKPHEIEELRRNSSAWFREWAQAGFFARIEWE